MNWILKEKIDDKTRLELNSFSDIESQLLFNKKITNQIEADKYFSLDNFTFSSLPNIEKAAEEILKCVKRGDLIYVYGDYDVDGICSTSILFDFLFRHLKANVLPYIPNRFEEGYGLNSKSLEKILGNGAKLVITTDCGICDDKLISKFVKLGLNFVVVDHHTIPVNKNGKLNPPKKALAVVHPQLSKKDIFKSVCATFLAWRLCMAMDTKEDFVLNEYSDLVALATVCDIMPLISENRSVVILGLSKIRKNECNFGLRELIKVSEIEFRTFETYHFGFVIGPRLNATGRLEDALEGVRLLTSKSNTTVKELAVKLNKLNTKRQNLTEDMLNEAIDLATVQVQNEKQLIFVYGENWSEGIVGLVASKLNEKFHRPVMAASINNEKNIVKGSARSIKGFNITEAITQNKDILETFGGHSQAAGFSLKIENLEAFISNMQYLAKENITDDLIEAKLELDAILLHADLTFDLIKFINKLKPFGYGNSEPIFLIEKLKVFGTPRIIGKNTKHLKFSVLCNNNLRVDCLAFNLADKIDVIQENEFIDIAGGLAINKWNGNELIQIKVKDFKSSK